MDKIKKTDQLLLLRNDALGIVTIDHKPNSSGAAAHNDKHATFEKSEKLLSKSDV